MEDDRYTRITLRLPKELHAKLQEQADATSKSMNAEIVARLEGSFLGGAGMLAEQSAMSPATREALRQGIALLVEEIKAKMEPDTLGRGE